MKTKIYCAGYETTLFTRGRIVMIIVVTPRPPFLVGRLLLVLVLPEELL